STFNGEELKALGKHRCLHTSLGGFYLRRVLNVANWLLFQLLSFYKMGLRTDTT
ncbi:hypothetical protein BDY19DRAFT_935109, partial [Irpex rosettiformis]